MLQRSHPLVAILLTVGMTNLSWAGSPPLEDPPEPPVQTSTPTGSVDWHFHKNFIFSRSMRLDNGESARIVAAVDARELDPETRRIASGSPMDSEGTPFGAWIKRYEGVPDLAGTSGRASVVDEAVFSDLRVVKARDASKLGAEGQPVGRVKLKEYDPVDLVLFLVGSGIINANAHVEADVSGSYQTTPTGHWFTLRSYDPYWTNEARRYIHRFGVHISPAGEIRMMNLKFIEK